MVPALFGKVILGEIAIWIDQRFPLDHVALAHEMLEPRETTGGTVLELGWVHWCIGARIVSVAVQSLITSCMQGTGCSPAQVTMTISALKLAFSARNAWFTTKVCEVTTVSSSRNTAGRATEFGCAVRPEQVPGWVPEQMCLAFVVTRPGVPAEAKQ
ncbi:MAG: hypothetical protein GDA36_10555 [Rhodobacteraceae bacterium]|nr:hypothetical protein [Paracoccaceae bacterium]